MHNGGIRLIAHAALATATVLATASPAGALTPATGTSAPARPALAHPAAGGRGAPAPITAPAALAAFSAPAASAPAAAGERRGEAPAVPGRAAYLFDPVAGTVHLSRQAAKRMPVASLTKIMTTYVMLRTARLDDVVTIRAEDVRYAAVNGATHASLRAGERLTVRDLLYAVMLPSGADASHALARVYGPGTRRFVARMNATARSMGLADTVYTNPDGLPKPAPGHSTALDQAKLADIALRDPVMRTIASTGRHVVSRTKVHRAHTWINSNKLLGRTPGVIGLKTGYTRAAGYCLSFAADADGRRLVGVILGETNGDRRFRSAERLLEWAGEPAPPQPWESDAK
ncbi:D-alanyl-D-alanine carboxypeptidase family protein [Streptosporangium sp. NPDC050855]|uniref:D-alanyl-D-alanine carboxypeptidase family protein n=1 Tax=Streptosporangium sp. NPDC050855 TaxID=3366194 RepID=UPI0037B206F4